MALAVNTREDFFEMLDEENYVSYTTDKDDNIICYPNGHTIGCMKINVNKIVVPTTV